jgi:transglutaminase-like putative cysteine protease
MWLPVPRSDAHQEISGLLIDSDFPYTIHEDPEYGNRMLYVKADAPMPESGSVQVCFTVRREAVLEGGTRGDGPYAGPDTGIARFLLPDALVPVDGPIAEEASRVVAGRTSDLEKAKAIYDHLTRTLLYDKSGTGWGRGDALFACNVRRGNCTDFHSLFIGMARASGIPARFVIGFPLPPDANEGDVPGYHCWAEFYTDASGWIPVDASEAHKRPEMHEFYFGGLDPDRVQFTIGRDIRLEPPVTAARVNYFIYPFALVDGKLFEKVETHFRFSESCVPDRVPTPVS